MATKAQGEVPAGMQIICRRFERWRSSHRGRLPIPGGLWASAAAVAREHGVFQTAKVLRLEYGKLVQRATGRGAPCEPGLSECLMELEGPRGKIRIQWKGTTAPDLAGLSRALWESA